MVDITAALPLSFGGMIATLINAIIAFIAIILVDKFIGHNFEPKRAFIMALVALFVTPIVAITLLGSTALPGYIAAYVLPLVVWIGLGEVLLQGEGMKTKLEVAIIAFVIYSVLQIVLAPAIVSLIP